MMEKVLFIVESDGDVIVVTILYLFIYFIHFLVFNPFGIVKT